MDNAKAVIGDLETASKEHEKEVVIELGTDRLIRWLGVYFLLFLAIVAKIGELAATNVTCYPANMTSGPDGAFITFANEYCWTSALNNVSSTFCQPSNFTAPKLLLEPEDVKSFVKWLPYVIIAQAFLISFPLSYWHFRVGARLIGHLKFMQLLLIEIFENVKRIPKGGYYEKPYDKTGAILDGKRGWPIKDDQLSDVNVTCPPATSNETGKKENDKLVNDNQGQSGTTTSKNQANTENPDDNKIKLSRWDRFMVGDMKDRNFFSMLCFENFASLHHLPYIMSVFKVSECVPDEDEPERDLTDVPLLESMLLLWCDKNNFGDVFLLRVYALKHIFTALLTLIMLIGLCVWFFGFVISDVIWSDTFWCEIPYQTTCLLCSIKRINDVAMLFTVDVIITLAVFVLSVWKWFDVRGSTKRESAHYFDVIQETSNVALLAASMLD